MKAYFKCFLVIILINQSLQLLSNNYQYRKEVLDSVATVLNLSLANSVTQEFLDSLEVHCHKSHDLSGFMGMHKYGKFEKQEWIMFKILYLDDKRSFARYVFGLDFSCWYDWVAPRLIIKKYLNNVNHSNFNVENEIDSFYTSILVDKSIQRYNKTADSIDGIYIPKDIDDALNHIHIFFNEKSLEEFKNQSEDNATGIAHLGAGMGMRNCWRLWTNSRLKEHFKSLGVRDGDRISGILLDLYHRKLNNKPLKLNELLESIKIFEQEDYDKRSKSPCFHFYE